MTHLQSILLPLLLLLSCCFADESSEQYQKERKAERLKWLTVTQPNQRNIRISCASRFEYPFSLLENDTQSIGREIKQMWWLLPDRSIARPGYNDGNRQIVNGGSEMLVGTANDAANGLYHCVAEAENQHNASQIHVYYYKRGLNVYGPDLYNGSLWEKYKFNLLTGSLTSGTFLALVAGWILMQKFGVCSNLRSSTVADVNQNTNNSDSALSSSGAAELMEIKAGASSSKASLGSRGRSSEANDNKV